MVEHGRRLVALLCAVIAMKAIGSSDGVGGDTDTAHHIAEKGYEEPMLPAELSALRRR